MDSIDVEVIQTSLQWLKQGHQVLLVTTIKTWGSAPRPVGAMLSICDDGKVCGSVSGGCIEDDLILRVKQHGIQQTLPELLHYGISADQAHQFGLPCGGTIELMLEVLNDSQLLQPVLDAILHKQLISRTLDVATGKVLFELVTTPSPLQFNQTSLIVTFGPQYRLLIIGGGQLSRFLCEMAVGLDFEVTVCDPREAYHDILKHPQVTLLTMMPDDAVTHMQLDGRSAVIAVTHDPKLDDLALMEALKTPAFYVGALGSRKNNALRRERLQQYFDIKQEEIDHLHGPVGIYIGSKTPPEIAVSIMAEIIAVKNNVEIPKMWLVENAKSQRDIIPNITSVCSI